ncbi:MAG: hypothetical protein ABW019_11930 [Chitinophagaceae bacterium]
MVFYLLFFIVVCGILAGVTIVRKDAWPFSWYPMYAAPHAPEKVTVIRIALQAREGSVTWWRSRFYRYPEYTGRRLLQLQKAAAKRTGHAVFITLERNKLLLEVLRLIESEDASASHYKAFHIVERTVGDNLVPHDRTLEIVSFSELRNGKPA